MTPRNDPLLLSAVSRVVSAYSAACHEHDDLPAFLRLLDDPQLGLTQDENAVIRNASDQRLTMEVYAEVLKRQAEGCWPHSPARQQQAPN